MKKLFSAALLTSVAALSPFASAAEEDLKWYVVAGFGIGSGEEEGDSNYSYYNYTADFDSTGFKLGGGYIFSDLFRLEISYAGEEMEFTDVNATENFSSLDFDGIWAFTDYPVRPYLLAGIGLTAYQDTAEYLEGDDGDLNGISIQLGAGGIWRAAPNFELDAGLKIRGVGWQELEGSNSSANLEISTSLAQFTFGARVLF